MSRPADLKMGDIVHYTNRTDSGVGVVLDPDPGGWVVVSDDKYASGVALNPTLTDVRRLTTEERLAYEAGHRDARREADPIRVFRDPSGRVEIADVPTSVPGVIVEFAPAEGERPTRGAWEIWGVRIGPRLYPTRRREQWEARPRIEDGSLLEALRIAAR